MPLVVPLVAAIVALLAIFAFYEFTQAVVGLLRHIPYIGKYVANLAEVALIAIYQFLQGAFALSARLFNTVFVLPVSRFLDMFHNIAKTVSEIVTTCFWIANSLVKHVYDRLVALVDHLVSAARAYALTLYHDARAYARGLWVAAEHYAQRIVAALDATLRDLVHAARAYAAALVAGARHYALSLYHKAVADAAALVATAEADLTVSIKAAEALARSEVATVTKLVSTTAGKVLHEAEAFTAASVAAVVGVLTVDIPGIVDPVWDQVITDVGVLQGVLATDFPELSALLDSLPGVDALDLASTLTGTLTLTRVMTRYMARCGVPNCRNLSSIGRALQDLFGLVEGAAFLAVLADMIADPQGAAREIDDVLSPIVDPLVSGARNLLGVG